MNMMITEDILKNGFEICQIKDGRFRVYTKDTYWFVVNAISDLTPERMDLEKTIYQDKLRQQDTWSANFWAKVDDLKKSNALPTEKVWFIADTHFGHDGILRHCSERGFTTTKEQDSFMLDAWNTTIGKKDKVYILGDFYWKNRVGAVALLHKLHGAKHFIEGNHDAAVEKLHNMFESMSQIKTVRFKQTQYPYIEDSELVVTMSHYPMVSFYQKARNSIQLHGHVHGNLDTYNEKSTDLRVDVGWDSKAIAYHGFVDLEHLYEHYMRKRILVDNLMENL